METIAILVDPCEAIKKMGLKIANYLAKEKIELAFCYVHKNHASYILARSKDILVKVSNTLSRCLHKYEKTRRKSSLKKSLIVRKIHSEVNRTIEIH